MVPLDKCGIVFGIMYLFDQKEIFYREHNQYHLFKEGIEYRVHSRSFKNERSLGTTKQLKRVINASHSLTLRSLQFKEEKNRKHEMEVSLHHKTPIIVDNVLMVRRKHDMGTNLSYVQV